MKILFIGDVFGKPGRRVLRRYLGDLKDQYDPELTVVNAENAAGGFGVTASVLDELLGDGEIDEKFGFLLGALAAGAPPHGGIALGMDRIVQRFTGSGSLRDVIAFPKTTAARALFEGAPTAIDDAQLEALGITVTKRNEEG